uniref:BTB domain-containing protein n=1 Tax=Bionectria ochroleuca TaxID=29856 RepID=A0A8H7TQM8_BIOOC
MEDGQSDTENNRIQLRVGERLFHTTKETLTRESDYFAARLARWKDTDPDGSYFIDSDPTLFEVILRYLRTGTPPLFFDPATQTHDVAKYAALLSEARYFQIPSLVTWIVEQKYFQVIQVDTNIRVYDEDSFRDLPTSSSSSTSKVEYFQTTGIERRFVCVPTRVS